MSEEELKTLERADVSDQHGIALLDAIGPRREPVLYRWTTPDRGEGDGSDEPIEYAVTSLPDEPSLAGYGGVMLWGRYGRGWIANPGGRSLVAHLLDELRAARAIYERDTTTIAALTANRDKLAAFKAYVHQRLDDAGVPADPESTHKAEGCRIGGRLDVVFAECTALTAELSALARESVERSVALAKIEAEVIASRDIVRACEASRSERNRVDVPAGRPVDAGEVPTNKPFEFDAKTLATVDALKASLAGQSSSEVISRAIAMLKVATHAGAVPGKEEA